MRVLVLALPALLGAGSTGTPAATTSAAATTTSVRPVSPVSMACAGATGRRTSSLMDGCAAEGPVAWYRMDVSAAENLVVDDAGGHDGMCQPGQCPVPIAGKVGVALRFDGVDDHVRIPDDPDFYLSPGSATAWVYYSGPLTGVVVGKPCGLSDSDAWLLFVDPQNDALASVGFETGGDAVLRTTSAFEQERWTHLAVTWTPSRRRIYVNGDMKAEGAVAVTMDYDSRDVLLGGDADAGALDEIRVYGRELSAVEIADEAGGK